jgi:cytochrome c biogenesis protein CcdA
MGGIDDALAGLSSGSLVVALLVAVLLGLRHATDPDHLTAVATLIVSDANDGPARARRLGLAWGCGHATTLFAFGLPVVLVGSALPEPVQQAAELAIGIVIIGLALRLLDRWRRGCFHTHPHAHDGVVHAHPHVHEERHAEGGAPAHGHTHAETVGRSPAAAFGIGLIHGTGGSAAAGVLLVGAVSDTTQGVAALALFAAATAVSMALLSTGVGLALARGLMGRRLESLVPVMGTASLLFGVWYALGALPA